VKLIIVILSLCGQPHDIVLISEDKELYFPVGEIQTLEAQTYMLDLFKSADKVIETPISGTCS